MAEDDTILPPKPQCEGCECFTTEIYLTHAANHRPRWLCATCLDEVEREERSRARKQSKQQRERSERGRYEAPVRRYPRPQGARGVPGRW